MVANRELDAEGSNELTAVEDSFVSDSAAVFASSISLLNRFTKPSKFLSLSLILAILGVTGCWGTPGRFSRFRAHLGGPSADGTIHAIPARRQFEQGDLLSQRTLRDRQVTQLRGLVDAGAFVRPDPVGLGAGVGMDSELNQSRSIVSRNFWTHLMSKLVPLLMHVSEVVWARAVVLQPCPVTRSGIL